MDDDVHSSFLWLRPPKARVLLQVRRKITAILRCSTSVQDIIASLCRGTSGLDIDLRVVDINQVIVKLDQILRLNRSARLNGDI